MHSLSRRLRAFTALAVVLGAVACAYAANVTVLVKPGVPMFHPGKKEHGMEVFPTIQNALDHAPQPKDGGRVIIRITPGIYHERIWVAQNRPNVELLGLGKSSADTVITAGHFAKESGGTFFTETAEIAGNGFIADNLTFANSAGRVGQALAISVLADRAIFKHCRFLGYQDTLFANYGRQYYVDDYIQGAVDFIFGNATAVFDHDTIDSIGSGFITAQSRLRADSPTGYVIRDSTLTIAPQVQTDQHRRHFVGLGRPWRPYARVIYLNTYMPPGILPQGWVKWNATDPAKTTFYAEYHCKGPGANQQERVPWEHKLTKAEVRSFQPDNFLRGNDDWNSVAEAAALH